VTPARALLAVVLLPALAAALDRTAHERAERTIAEVRPAILIPGGLYSGLFTSVTGVHCDRRTGEIYVADPGSGAIEIFDEDGAPLFAFADDEHLLEPMRVAVGPDDRIYVIDNDRTRIKVFSYRGEFLEHLELPGVDVRKKPAFTAITFDARGDLYVGESRTGQVLAFDKDLRPILRIGSYGEAPGQFNGIAGIAVDSSYVYVSSVEGIAVQVFTRQGRYVRGWGHHDAGLHNVSLPAGIAVDAKGRVILLDTLRQEIKYFDAQGRLIDLYGGLGKQAGAVAYPTDLSMDRKGRLCVADGGNHRVQVLEPVEAQPAEPAQAADPAAP
jgi:DNA-binding beta-propeller fold protein YncE